MTSTPEPEPAPAPAPDQSPDAVSPPSPESRAERLRRHGHRARLYTWAVLLVALLVVLVVHEGAHAVLTRIARVPLRSSGIAFFGIIPVGAFVEPDEKKLAAVPAPAQTRVLVAGATANLVTCCAFFILFVACVLVINSLGLMSTAYAPAVRFVYTFLGLSRSAGRC
jgi:membrane-associated protease RseP (regulator of RpoE activity)